MNLRVTRDYSDKFRAQNANTLAVVLGVEKDPAIVNDVRKDPGATDIHGLMRSCLLKNGTSINTLSIMDPHQVYQNSICSNDLPAIFSDVMSKALIANMESAPYSYKTWVKTDYTPDFKEKKLLKLSSIGDIDDLPEGMPFKQAKLSDSYEPISVTTKGKLLRITRQAMLNNEVDLLREIPAMLGRAIENKKNRTAYDLLTSNSLTGPTLNEDSKAVFHADHNNIVENSGVLSVESVGVAEQKLLDQTAILSSPDAPSSYLNLSGKYLICGTVQRLRATQLLGSPYDPAYSGQVINPYAANYLYPVFDPYLQSLLTAAGYSIAFYLAADKIYSPSLVICYLTGAEEPTLRTNEFEMWLSARIWPSML